MKASELIQILQEEISKHGDQDVFVYGEWPNDGEWPPKVHFLAEGELRGFPQGFRIEEDAP